MVKKLTTLQGFGPIEPMANGANGEIRRSLRVGKSLFCKANGFSFIELMVVVAISAILVTIATSKVEYLVYKARQAEAKGTISSLFSAESVFFAQYSNYTTAIDATGFEVVGNPLYSVGFGTGSSAPPPVPQGTCTFTCWGTLDPDLTCAHHYANWKCTNHKGGYPSLNATVPDGTTPNPWQTFRAEAVGTLNPNSPDDVWSITDTKFLVNDTSGL